MSGDHDLIDLDGVRPRADNGAARFGRSIGTHKERNEAMKHLEVTAPAGVTVPAGAVISGLTDDQVRRRRHRMVEVEGGVFRLDEALFFKRGETFDVDDTSLFGRALNDGVKSEGGKARAKTDVTGRAREGMAPNATAKAIDKAVELGVDLGPIEGTGRGGKISVADVIKAVKAAELAEAAADEGGADRVAAGDADAVAGGVDGDEATLV